MKLTREKAEQLALDYVNKDKNKNFKLELIEVGVSKISMKYWAATFEVRTLEEDMLDGPLLILVDDDLEKAMSLDEAVESHIANRGK